MFKPKGLPDTPGVYLFKNARGKIIYVGKAINLKNRVGSYFQKFESLLPKTQLLVSEIAGLDYVRVESEIEALILEVNLIKKHKPHYNIRLKDDKDYVYIKITKEDFPTVELARGKDLKGSKKYFGPFPNGGAARTLHKTLRRLFPFRTCKVSSGKPCFYYHLGLCLGPCIGAVDKKTYNLMIRRMVRFLEGHKEEVVKELTADMQHAASVLQFERAGQIKRQLEAIGYVTEKRQLIDRYIENPNLIEDLKEEALHQLAEQLNLKGNNLKRIECYDNSNIQGTHATSSMVVFTDGEPDKSNYRKFRIKKVKGQDDYAYMKEVLTRRFHHLVTPAGKWKPNADESFDTIPDLIVIDGGKGQLAVAKKVLDDLNFEIQVISLAKRLEEIYLPNNQTPLRLPRDSEALKLVQHMRDEAHRFALGYSRKLREKSLLGQPPLH